MVQYTTLWYTLLPIPYIKTYNSAIYHTYMKKILIVIFLLTGFNSFSQDTLTRRMDNIDSTMRTYGKQQSIANKITIVSIATITIGTILGVPATPLLIVNTVGDLITILITSKSNKKLSKHKSN